MARAKKILCGLYVRVSTEEQAQVAEGSLKNQEERLKDFIKWKNEGATDETWIVVDTYQDVKSAKDTNRPSYQRMHQDIQDGRINMVLFTELSRLSRSTMDFLQFGEFAHEHDTNFLCLSHRDLDTSTIYGKAFFTLISILMEFEREINSTRSKEAYNSRSNRGLKNGGHVFGYDLDADNHGHLAINSEEAKVVRFMFKEYLKKQSINAVVKSCNQRGYRTKSYTSRRGRKHVGKPFIYSTIKNMLQNPVYIARNELHKANKGKADVPEGEEYRCIQTDKWKPIIREEDFSSVQQLLSRNRKAKSKTPSDASYDYLLSDLLYCEHCNRGNDVSELSALTHGGTRKNGKLFPHYIHRKGCSKDDCPLPHSLSAEKLDDVIWSKLVDEHANSLNETILKSAYLEHERSDIPRRQQELENDIAELKKVISEQEAEHDNILKSMGKQVEQAGKRIVEFLNNLSADIEALKKQLVERENELEEMQKQHSIDAQVAKLLKSKRKSFNKLPADQKMALAKVLLKRIVLRERGLMLEQRVGDPIIGILKEHHRRDGKKSISNPWRFVEVEWLG